MRDHIHVGPQLVDEAAVSVLRGRFDDLVHHLLDCHGGAVGSHDLLAELQQELQTHALMSQPIHGGVTGPGCRVRATELIRSTTALHI